MEKRGGRLQLNSHVDQILLDESGTAKGVKLKNGKVIHATKAVVSSFAIVYNIYIYMRTKHLASLHRYCDYYLHMYISPKLFFFRCPMHRFGIRKNCFQTPNAG